MAMARTFLTKENIETILLNIRAPIYNELRSYKNKPTILIVIALNNALESYLQNSNNYHYDIAKPLKDFTSFILDSYNETSKNLSPLKAQEEVNRMRAELTQKTYNAYCAARREKSKTLAPALYDVLCDAFNINLAKSDINPLGWIMGRRQILLPQLKKIDSLLEKLRACKTDVQANLDILYTTQKSKDEIISELEKIIVVEKSLNLYGPARIKKLCTTHTQLSPSTTREELICSMHELYLVIREKYKDSAVEDQFAIVLASALNLAGAPVRERNGEFRFRYSPLFPFEKTSIFTNEINTTFPIDAMMETREALKKMMSASHQAQASDAKDDNEVKHADHPEDLSTFVEENLAIHQNPQPEIDDESEMKVSNEEASNGVTAEEEKPLVGSPQPTAAAQSTPFKDRQKFAMFGGKIEKWRIPAIPGSVVGSAPIPKPPTELEEALAKRRLKMGEPS